MTRYGDPLIDMSIKSIILKKGWAGKTISRSETAERVNTLILPLVELLHLYNAALNTDSGSNNTDVKEVMPILRADIGKLAETVHSCGGTAYSGVDLQPESYSQSSPGWSEVLNRELSYQKLLEQEAAVEHQMRTRAIIGAVTENSITRSGLLSNR